MNLLYLVCLLPLLGSLLLMVFRHMSHRAATVIGVGSVVLSALVTAGIDTAWLMQDHRVAWSQTLWTWMSDGNFQVPITLRLDGLSLTMISVVTGVGALIHLFASWYMTEDQEANPGYLYTRFFACMNLFVFSMLMLVLGDNLLVLFFGWEGVGVCSYLLIGYYYRDKANTWAAFKAFIMTRLGDIFLAIAMFLIWAHFGTLNMQAVLDKAPAVLGHHRALAELIALLMLGGAVGKSAQLPLQTWLADAMAGPTPVSALIHAATMVTAGVYLIARMHGIYELAPFTLQLVGVIGAATLVMAGLSALAQTDIKRILAYSTMSQIGYMFLALGVQAWDAAIFHLMVHAFFKALLFLASGSVIVACHHEQNIYKMGGLARQLRLPWISFLLGGSALSALPIFTSGFYSKDEILWLSVASGHTVLWLAGLFGALLTSIYTFRLIFVVFHGECRTRAHAPHGISHALPLCILAILSTVVGAMIVPPLSGVLPTLDPEVSVRGLKTVLEVLSSVVALFGVLLAAILFLGQRRLISTIVETPFGKRLWRCFHSAFGFDRLYDVLFVRSFLLLTRAQQIDWIDRISNGLQKAALAWPQRGHQADWIDMICDLVPSLVRLGYRALSATQNGRLRHYAATFIAGATVVTVLLMLG
ncbi:NADH-quinone oxidoreductase subunit L [Zymobacter sp. IVIA_5232.4 C2]|uniref:NADH-quinone oxidoreductase subunit L n=1 Tax=Zymobacter sp. IVIA_5232.4 C2 TaxID=3394855 RepID=UPI0039C4354B